MSITNQDIVSKLIFIEDRESAVVAFSSLKKDLMLERAYARPSLKPEDQLAIHAELAYSMAQIDLVDTILEALTLDLTKQSSTEESI